MKGHCFKKKKKKLNGYTKPVSKPATFKTFNTLCINKMYPMYCGVFECFHPRDAYRIISSTINSPFCICMLWYLQDPDQIKTTKIMKQAISDYVQLITVEVETKKTSRNWMCMDIRCDIYNKYKCFAICIKLEWTSIHQLEVKVM